MSIYSTLWILKFPRYGDSHYGCDWIEVVAQGVPPHIGNPTPGYGYEAEDPYASFLPPPLTSDPDAHPRPLRAVVFVTRRTPKGTDRSWQEYNNPLLILSGSEYEDLPFEQLYDKICEALRGDRPRVVAEIGQPGGSIQIVFEDGSSTLVPSNRNRK